MLIHLSNGRMISFQWVDGDNYTMEQQRLISEHVSTHMVQWQGQFMDSHDIAVFSSAVEGMLSEMCRSLIRAPKGCFFVSVTAGPYVPGDVSLIAYVHVEPFYTHQWQLMLQLQHSLQNTVPEQGNPAPSPVPYEGRDAETLLTQAVAQHMAELVGRHMNATAERIFRPGTNVPKEQETPKEPEEPTTDLSMNFEEDDGPVV